MVSDFTHSQPHTHILTSICTGASKWSGQEHLYAAQGMSYWDLVMSLMCFWQATVKHFGDRSFTLFRSSYQTVLCFRILLTSVSISCKRSHVSLSVLPCLFEICVCFPGGLRRQAHAICCNLAAVIQLTSLLCCGLISAQAFRSWQTQYVPQFCFWERFPWSSFLGMVSCIISRGDPINPYSAVSSHAFTHTFTFIVHLYHYFLSVTKGYKLVFLFLPIFCACFLHFHLQFNTMFVNGKFLVSCSTCLQNTVQKYFFPPLLTKMPVLVCIPLCHDAVTILRNRQ